MNGAPFRRGVRAVLLVAVLVSASCSAYFNPTVDLVLHLADEDTRESVVSALDQFARERQLTAYHDRDHSPVPESVRQDKAKTTYYVSGVRPNEGRSLTFFDASPTCKVVRVVEASRRWQKESEADLAELRASLSALAGVTVEEGARFDGEGPGGRPLNEYCPAQGA